jgi:FKBP-type peptidyl-prolyl cis-trans isomerase FklB
MKRITFLPFLLLLVITFSACEEDKYVDWKLLNESWLETHKSDSGFIQTESGLCYKVIHQGYMRRPNSASNIVVKYSGKLVDGTVFDSSDEYSTNLSYMIKGWIEGVSKMNVGGRYIFYIPASLAYDADGSGDIPPYSTLIFDVTLLDSEDQL